MNIKEMVCAILAKVRPMTPDEVKERKRWHRENKGEAIDVELHRRIANARRLANEPWHETHDDIH